MVGGGGKISSVSKLVFGIAGEGWKHKFWKFEAQIAQIKHEFDPMPNLLPHFGPQPPKTDAYREEWGEALFRPMLNFLPHFGWGDGEISLKDRSDCSVYYLISRIFGV